MLVLVLFTAACAGGAPLASVDDLPTDTRAKAPEPLWNALAAGEPRSFILAIAPATTARTAAGDPATARRLSKARVRAVVEAAADPGVAGAGSVEQDWDELPLIQVRARSLDAALAFVDRDEVVAAHEIVQYAMSDAQSFPLIDQPAAAAAGQIGSDTTVAVLDTGVDYTRPDFGACTAPGAPAATCRVAFAQDFAPDDGARDANGHGSNVAGIAAGVAPGTRILALDVFNGESASSTDLLSAINWTLANQRTYRIAALNLSLGGGSSATPCTGDAVGVALATARGAGIAPVVAAGNDGTASALAWPACAPAAISVGAVYDANVGGLAYGNCRDLTTAADQVACFSNAASFLTVLAPGALITAAGVTMAGTSQATPHVAGALAVLRAAFPAETVDQLVARLATTGKPIRDPRNGLTTPRIDLAAALHAGASDVTPPTGSVTINGGAAATRSTQVQLAITASDDGAVSQMCITNTTACTAFVPFAASKPWALAAGDGRKTVTVVLRDAAGNTTALAASPRASITLDTAPPGNGKLGATPGDAQLALAWAGFTDAGAGIAGYRVVIAAGSSAPACTATPAYAGTAAATTITGLVNGTTYSARVCAVDAAGNVSTGAVASAIPHPDAAPPTGSLQINAGAPFATSRSVRLTLGARGATQVTQMCVSETATCTSFGAYATTAAYTFTADGKRTLYARFRDAWGLVSEPVAASITVDTVAPAGGVLTATAGPAGNALAWSAASDAGSGLAGYKLVGAAGSVPPAERCATGTVLYVGAATSFAHALATRATWTYRLCARDEAGNVAVGSVKAVLAK
ncbi:MAG TPA: S8 family serine peptidase [Kofleriaceae bacterium]|nr:S8 family serine peptidase [Kofleriaceae bacterium]